MSIFSAIASIIKNLGDKANKFNQEVLAYTEEYANESDEYLKRKVKNGYKAQKIAAARLLKERGHSVDNQNSKN